MKRKDYLSWDEYFMGVAELSALRSKDPSTQVGACIVSMDNKILSMGYNGFPMGCSDDEFPWTRAIESELDIPVKYIGVGESIDDLQKFDSDQFVNALFNMTE